VVLFAKLVLFFVVFLCFVPFINGQSILNTYSIETPPSTTISGENKGHKKYIVFVLPPDFHTKQFGFFCKQELRLQRTNIPLAFRLGSMDMCNALEQKAANR
jgi:hypothetical protein